MWYRTQIKHDTRTDIGNIQHVTLRCGNIVGYHSSSSDIEKQPLIVSYKTKHFSLVTH